MEERERENQTACISLFKSLSLSPSKQHSFSMEERQDEHALWHGRGVCANTCFNTTIVPITIFKTGNGSENKRQCNLLQSLFSSSLLSSLLTELQSETAGCLCLTTFLTTCNVLRSSVHLGFNLEKRISYLKMFPCPFLHYHTEYCNFILYARTISDLIIELVCDRTHPLHSYSFTQTYNWIRWPPAHIANRCSIN